MVNASYAGSFDPITRGHLWIIETSAYMFDQLLVFVSRNTDKNSLFSPEERVSLIQSVTAHIPNVTVLSMPPKALLARFSWKQGAHILVRGIRSADDYDKERMMLHVNRQIQTGIETVFLMPPKEIAEVSSSLVKNLVGLDGWKSIVAEYVPRQVLEALSDKYAQSLSTKEPS